MRPIVVCAVGTRPEAVKMAPVILRLRRESARLDLRVLATGQHRALLDRALADFAITPDADLDLMQPDQRLTDVAARALAAVGDYLARERPALVLAQGDTTTVLATALACHYTRVPFAHVEAGLRTGNASDPFPEEKNRVVASHLAALHFAPTPRARHNLLREGIADEAVHVTGNTVIDALLHIASTRRALPVVPATRRFVLATIHRRENFGAPLQRICAALCDLVQRDTELSVVIPVHPNPSVQHTIHGHLASVARIHLIEPVGYAAFVALMNAAAAIVTDSGGVQEEAPTLGKPVLVVRETTERPEALETGLVRLIGTSRGAIVDACETVLRAGDRPTCRGANPYGDGWASERIARIVLRWFAIEPPPAPAGYSPYWPVNASSELNVKEQLLGGSGAPA